jgi:hypothetical protein
VVVFKYYIERNVFCCGFNLSCLLDNNLEYLPFTDFCLCVANDSAIRRDLTIGKQTCESGTAEVRFCWHIAGQRLIKTRRRVGPNVDAMDGSGHGKRNGSG